MNVPEIVDLSSDEEDVEADVKPVIHKDEHDIKPVLNRDPIMSSVIRQRQYKSGVVLLRNCETPIKKERKDDGSLYNSKTVQSSSRTSDQESSVIDGSSPCSASPLCSAPISRQFWKAGNYDAEQASKIVFPNGKTHLRVHPKFLHSNATSHKWALGAIAELLDNAVDEIQNGATFVIVDKISNPRDGSPALLIQDDGGGMDPECIRRCMSFGFSEKKSNVSIGQYGNGFKTSTMRLGADVIVFTRCLCNGILTQSVGLLSYTFLRQTGCNDIVVPMVDYKFDQTTGEFRPSCLGGDDQFASNLSVLLKWSPYATVAELLKQFDDIGHHGAIVIVFNLWLNDDGGMELDFESDAEDIMISGAPKVLETNSVPKMLNQQHIANRYRYSLRVYSSILYMRIPENFRIILRGRVVELHNIGTDLKFPEFILYRPQVGGNVELSVITTIGFLKDAPHVNIHGFNVYHKNRLVLPFWRVVNQTNSRGRGVVGILEANFLQPTHDKQDFERTPLFQKLESRLKEMTLEYWDFHCGLIGYHQAKKTPPKPPVLAHGRLQPVVMNSRPSDTSTPAASAPNGYRSGRPMVTALSAPNVPNPIISSQSELAVKRKRQSEAKEFDLMKRLVTGSTGVMETGKHHEGEAHCQSSSKKGEVKALMQENQKLLTQCKEYEKMEEELQRKVKQLEIELQKVNDMHKKLLREFQSMDTIKVEKL